MGVAGVRGGAAVMRRESQASPLAGQAPRNPRRVQGRAPRNPQRVHRQNRRRRVGAGGRQSRGRGGAVAGGMGAGWGGGLGRAHVDRGAAGVGGVGGAGFRRRETRGESISRHRETPGESIGRPAVAKPGRVHWQHRHRGNPWRVHRNSRRRSLGAGERQPRGGGGTVAGGVGAGWRGRLGGAHAHLAAARVAGDVGIRRRTTRAS